MKVVYVAGPIRGRSLREREFNIRRAEEVAFEVWKTFLAVPICVHPMARVLGDDDLAPGAEGVERLLDGDLELVRRSDALLLVWGWEASYGTLREKAFAESLDKPVFDDVRGQPFREWLHCRRADYVDIS